MKKKTIHKIIVMLMLTSMTITMLIGCNRQDNTSKTDDPVITFDSSAPVDSDSTDDLTSHVEPAGSTESVSNTEAESVRKDGERFEEIIMLEGMEETVRYEHVKNDTIGFEIGYDYESLVRRSESDRERFISIYDDPENPEIYLELTYKDENIDAVAKPVEEALSNDYDIIREQSFLVRAGNCIRIDASSAKGGGIPDKMQMIYIIPAGDGCIFATEHYGIESAEGFGRRFDYIMNTLVVS